MPNFPEDFRRAGRILKFNVAIILLFNGFSTNLSTNLCAQKWVHNTIFLKVKTKNHSFCSLEPPCLSSTYNYFPFEPKMGLEPTTCSLRMKLKKAMLSFEFQFLVTLLQKCSDKPFDKPFDKPSTRGMTKIRLILHRHKDKNFSNMYPNMSTQKTKHKQNPILRTLFFIPQPMKWNTQPTG